MEKFTFSLTKVLEYRKGQEKQAKRIYAAAQKELNEAEKQLEDKKIEKDSLLNIQEATINRMQVQQWYLLELNQKIQESIQQIQKLTVQTDKALNRYIEAQKERKVLEKLADKHFAEYQLQANREEQKMLDEMAGRRIKIS
ncbi:MAG TPA: flagellar export protein FliJ [Candidatus Tetragenococcus pullicola]|nr:flagellar export protein FliJ [Candidatus Tetragenococcus pullicola]